MFDGRGREEHRWQKRLRGDLAVSDELRDGKHLRASAARGVRVSDDRVRRAEVDPDDACSLSQGPRSCERSP